MAEKKEKQYYTLEEIAKHNGKETDRVWIIYKDSVYDCTDYLDDHPGGGELITEWAGVDSTKEFDKAGHSGDAMRDLKKYKIGEVVEEQRKKAKKSAKSSGATVVESTEKKQTRSYISIITCGLCC